jgi:flagellar biosynthesis regulator FlbT
LKYLIDTENHQGLYNITTVLGQKFFVNNDIEKKDRAVYIELRNDATTKNHWQIILMRKTAKK